MYSFTAPFFSSIKGRQGLHSHGTELLSTTGRAHGIEQAGCEACHAGREKDVTEKGDLGFNEVLMNGCQTPADSSSKLRRGHFAAMRGTLLVHGGVTVPSHFFRNG